MKNVNIKLIIAAITVCANFGGQDSSSVSGAGDRPAINFKGELVDTTGAKVNVEFITIGGLFKQIPVFAKPTSANANPTDNTSYIDLAETHSIKIPNPDIELKFKDRGYIELEITSKDSSQTKHTYIIESTKRLRCAEKNSAGDIEKELAFRAVSMLTITGYEKPKADNKDMPSSSSTKK